MFSKVVGGGCHLLREWRRRYQEGAAVRRLRRDYLNSWLALKLLAAFPGAVPGKGERVTLLGVRRSFCVERGDIYLLELEGENGARIKQPVLVIQNDIGNRWGDSLIVVPLLPGLCLKNSLLGVVLRAGGSVGLATDHTAVFSQILTVDKSRCKRDNYLGHPDLETMLKVDEAIRLSLGLSTVQRLQTRQQLHQRWRRLFNNRVG